MSSNVTVVITDEDDEIPKFNREKFNVAVPEDVGEGGLSAYEFRALFALNAIY